MFCQRCGSEIPNGLSICQQCGTPVQQPAPQPVNYQQPVPQPVNYQQPVPQPVNYQQPVQQLVNIKSHMADSIITMILCCLPFGIIGLVYACKVNAALKNNDVAAAQHASKMANMWNWIGFGCGLLWAITCVACALGGFPEF